MTDTLLFLHVLSAFLLMGTVVVMSAPALGSALPGRTLSVANALWAAGGFGTLVFGIWLAIDADQIDFFDFWVIAGIVLWAIASELGRRAQDTIGSSEARGDFARWHWLRAAVVVLLLIDMIFKPGAGS